MQIVFHINNKLRSDRHTSVYNWNRFIDLFRLWTIDSEIFLKKKTFIAMATLLLFVFLAALFYYIKRADARDILKQNFFFITILRDLWTI